MEPRARSNAVKPVPRRRQSKTPSARPNQPINLRPAAISGPIETEQEIRNRLARGLPRARRLVIRDRIELDVPADFQQQAGPSNDRASNPHIHDERDVVQASSASSLVRSQHSMVGASRDINGIQDLLVQLPHAWSPITVLGAGRVDPFISFPINMNPGEQYLMDQMNSGHDPRLRTYKENWLPVVVQHPASFHQFLANLAVIIHRNQRRGIQGREKEENLIAVAHHSLALRTINTVLEDPVRRVSDAVVASIVAFICYSTFNSDYKDYDTHINGLERIVQLRGGWESFAQNPTLRCMIFGVDIAGAASRDHPPRFPLPAPLIDSIRAAAIQDIALVDFYPQRSNLLQALVPHDTNLYQAITNTLLSLAYIKYKVSRNETWMRISFVVFWVEPIVYTLVGKHIADPSSSNVAELVQEAIRLGLMILLAKLRRICGQLGVRTQLVLTKLKNIIEARGDDMEWGINVKQALLWCLCLGLMESQEMSEGRWFNRMVWKVANEMGLHEWGDILRVIKDVLWVDVFDQEFNASKGGFIDE
ncbi:hypothetical protein EG329_000990 [Mollisiaceae sp. DMI_Dod_QoI]|nr:hypothetical protein EG329_000990 [Helotiales sp. DMI_Dod_QoI]